MVRLSAPGRGGSTTRWRLHRFMGVVLRTTDHRRQICRRWSVVRHIVVAGYVGPSFAIYAMGLFPHHQLVLLETAYIVGNASDSLINNDTGKHHHCYLVIVVSPLYLYKQKLTININTNTIQCRIKQLINNSTITLLRPYLVNVLLYNLHFQE